MTAVASQGGLKKRLDKLPWQTGLTKGSAVQTIK
jgi:hypothetical protein